MPSGTQRLSLPPCDDSLENRDEHRHEQGGQHAAGHAGDRRVGVGPEQEWHHDHDERHDEKGKRSFDALVVAVDLVLQPTVAAPDECRGRVGSCQHQDADHIFPGLIVGQQKQQVDDDGIVFDAAAAALDRVQALERPGQAAGREQGHHAQPPSRARSSAIRLQRVTRDRPRHRRSGRACGSTRVWGCRTCRQSSATKIRLTNISEMPPAAHSSPWSGMFRRPLRRRMRCRRRPDHAANSRWSSRLRRRTRSTSGAGHVRGTSMFQ